jgi:hypothetical protein
VNMDDVVVTRSRAVALGLLIGVLAALPAFTRHMARWGATDDELRSPLPGDDVVACARPTVTNAVTIDTPPERVWPWLVQIGRGRAGFYTYTWLENLIGADIHNLDRIDPALQHLVVGDRIWLTPERYLGLIPGQAWRVHTIVPGHTLVLEQRPPENPRAGTWALLAQPTRDGRTRLLSRHCTPPPQGPVAATQAGFWSLSSVMERRMLLGVKERAEEHPA